MKTLEHFDQHNGQHIRAVQKLDTNVALLSQRLVTRQCQLYEVWLMPEHEEAFSSAFLDRACFNSVEQLLRMYDLEVSPAPLHASGKRHILVAEFAINLYVPDTEFHFSVQRTPSGPVISVVFGSHRAMKQMYDDGLRTRSVPQVDAEPST